MEARKSPAARQMEGLASRIDLLKSIKLVDNMKRLTHAAFALSSLLTGDSQRQLGTQLVEIVELPPLKRGVEWPTAALAAAIYGLWLLTTFWYRDLPWWALTALGAWIVAWQLNLQHETIHGHPTRNRRINEMIGCWPLSLWLPYSIYRSTHLAHHRDENLTDPLEDPESYYWTSSGWGGLGPVWRAGRLYADDLAWPHFPRPGLFDLRIHPRSVARRLPRRTRRPPHPRAPPHLKRAAC